MEQKLLDISPVLIALVVIFLPPALAWAWKMIKQAAYEFAEKKPELAAYLKEAAKYGYAVTEQLVKAGAIDKESNKDRMEQAITSAVRWLNVRGFDADIEKISDTFLPIITDAIEQVIFEVHNPESPAVTPDWY